MKATVTRFVWPAATIRACEFLAQYRQMLQDRSTDKATREFIEGRIESASALKDAIEYRRQRLLKSAISSSIAKRRGFLTTVLSFSKPA